LAGLSTRDDDPLSSFRFGVDRVGQALGLLASDDPIDELHMRGGNKSGKSYTAAAYVLACLMKRKHLAGIPLPQWRGKVKGLQLVLDYPQQLLSVKPAYLELLGNWPAKIKTHNDYLTSIHVMPEGGSRGHEADWSVLHFLSQKNMDTGRGARADIIHFDEPPKLFFLQELRKAGSPGRRSVIVIGETPEKMKEWLPLLNDYGDTPRRSIRRVDQERAEVRWSLDEVAPWIISDQEKAKLKRRYANDPLAEAREHGDYTNAAGNTPWGKEGLQTLFDMLALATDFEPKTWKVPRETLEGDTKTIDSVTVEVFQLPKPGRSYYLNIDPASGQDDGAHHKAGLHLSEQGSGDLCIRWGGYLAPYSLGVLGATLARQYSERDQGKQGGVCEIDVEMKDHWGVNVVRGVQDGRMGHRIRYEQRELRPGEWAKEVGWDQNEEAKALQIGQIQEWLSAFRAGVKYARLPSREALQGLIDAELDERGKVVAGPGLEHGFDMILWGQKLRVAVARSNRPIPVIDARPKSIEDRLKAKILGLERPKESPAETGIGWMERPRL
jgi:hypothetical protein